MQAIQNKKLNDWSIFCPMVTYGRYKFHKRTCRPKKDETSLPLCILSLSSCSSRIRGFWCLLGIGRPTRPYIATLKTVNPIEGFFVFSQGRCILIFDLGKGGLMKLRECFSLFWWGADFEWSSRQFSIQERGAWGGGFLTFKEREKVHSFLS